MKAGYLSEFFAGVGLKTLSTVEADPARSNQHEYNGNKDLIRLFGRTAEKKVLLATFIYLADNDDVPLAETASVTWYDARANHPTRSEYRLYFPTSQVSLRAAEGDLLVIARRQDESVLMILAQGGSTIASQIEWLFSAMPLPLGFSVREELETERDRVGFASAFILEQLGIIVEWTEIAYLDAMLEKFGGSFPSTREFSAYARATLPEMNAHDDPDLALMAWMEREEILFRTLEKHFLTERLERGFAGDVDGFLRYSLSVQNRRKSRVGLALENHMETVLSQNAIRYGRTVATEGKTKPDFLFPGAAEYRNPQFDSSLLTMLGVKSTCKDRWRQVLAEAKRIGEKHLLTLEAAISRDQTNEMREHRVQLVVPRKIQATYSPEQTGMLFDVTSFVQLVRERQ